MLSRFAVCASRQGLGVVTRQGMGNMMRSGHSNTNNMSMKTIITRIQSTLAPEIGATAASAAQTGAVSRVVGWWLAGCAGNDVDVIGDSDDDDDNDDDQECVLEQLFWEESPD